MEAHIRQIIDIISPVHLPTCDEWMKIAEVTIPNNDYETTKGLQGFKLMQRFEGLTRGKWVNNAAIGGRDEIKYHWQPALLKKEHFVCEVEEPKPQPEMLGGWYNDKLKEYTEAQSKVWFEGFDQLEIEWDSQIGVRIWNRKNRLPITSKIKYTVFDFIYDMSDTDSPSLKGITINWTENFVNELVK